MNNTFFLTVAPPEMMSRCQSQTPPIPSIPSIPPFNFSAFDFIHSVLRFGESESANRAAACASKPRVRRVEPNFKHRVRGCFPHPAPRGSRELARTEILLSRTHAAPVRARLAVGFSVLGVVVLRVCQFQSGPEETYVCQPDAASSDPRLEQMGRINVAQRGREARSALRSRPANSVCAIEI